MLTTIGLGRLRSAPRPGLAALLEVAGGRPGAADAGAVGFRLGPRLNAAGRLEDASIALELLGSARPRRGAAARAPAQRAQPRAADHRGGHPRGGGRHGAGSAAGRAGALVAGLARGRRRHRRLTRGRALPPAGHPAQRGRRRGQGIRAQHPGVRPARRRRAHVGPPADVRRAPRRLRPAAAARRHPGVSRRVRRRGGGDAQRRRPAAGAPRRRHRRRRRAHARPRRRARASGAARVRQPPGDAPAARRRGRGAAADARQAARAVPGALRRRLLPGHPLQLRRPRRPHTSPAVTTWPWRSARTSTTARSARRCRCAACTASSRPSRTSARRRAISAAATGFAASGCGHSLLADGASGAPAPADADGDAAADALRAARADGRLVDRRGRPAVSQLAGLLAGGEPVLVLAADVARRRPLLTRDVLTPGLDCSGAYVQAACRHRLAATEGAGVVLTTPDLALDASGVRALVRARRPARPALHREHVGGSRRRGARRVPARALGRRRSCVRRPRPREPAGPGRGHAPRLEGPRRRLGPV